MKHFELNCSQKSIHTLVIDIQELLKQKDWLSKEISNELVQSISKCLEGQYASSSKTPTLRLSQMGPRCPKALWHSIHTPTEAESLPPWAEFKYSFGHIIEALAIALAKAAGHTVVGEQDEVVLDGVVGHRDCILDGCVVDVKSTSSIGFKKFQDGTLGQNDSFGYLEQLDGYTVASYEDPLVTVKDKAYILAIDKTLGHMCLYEHQIREQHIKRCVRDAKEIVARGSPPDCNCGTVFDGKSGNIRLDTKASYNVFKHCCFPHLRTFLYASGPVYLTKVVRKPDVNEVDKYGKIVYN